MQPSVDGSVADAPVEEGRENLLGLRLCSLQCRLFGDGFLELEIRWKFVTIPVTSRIPIAEGIPMQAHLCADKGF